MVGLQSKFDKNKLMPQWEIRASQALSAKTQLYTMVLTWRLLLVVSPTFPRCFTQVIKVGYTMSDNPQTFCGDDL